jgi:AraC-like DNA-binding protein
MVYLEKKISDHLSPFIQAFWTSETFDEVIENTILPDGYFDLIVQIEKEKIKSIKLTGLWTKPIEVKTQKNTKRLAIRFKPLAAEYLFDIDLKIALNNAITLPKTFWDLHQLSTLNFDTFSKHCKIKIGQLLALSKPLDKRKIKLFDLIFKKEFTTVKALSEQVFWNSRQINRYFQNQYGLSLKVYMNIVRCHATYKTLAKNNLTVPSSYFDQAHYIKEIKKMTGVSPKTLSQNKNDRFIQLSTIK